MEPCLALMVRTIVTSLLRPESLAEIFETHCSRSEAPAFFFAQLRVLMLNAATRTQYRYRRLRTLALLPIEDRV